MYRLVVYTDGDKNIQNFCPTLSSLQKAYDDYRKIYPTQDIVAEKKQWHRLAIVDGKITEGLLSVSDALPPQEPVNA